MLMSSVLAPSAFNAEYFTKEYRDNIVVLLRGVDLNGVLLAPSRKKLVVSLLEKVKKLPTQYQVHTRIALEELLKNRRQKIINCPVGDSYANEIETGLSVCTKALADAFFVSERETGCSKIDDRIVSIENYTTSDFETKRHELLKREATLDMLPKNEVDEIFTRVSKHSRILRFYDRCLTEGDNKAHFQRFHRGVEYILDLWANNGVFTSEPGCRVEIVTLQVRHSRDTSFALLKTHFLRPIRDKFRKWDVEILVKNPGDDNESRRKFHDRYLESDTAAVQIGLGFDFVKEPESTIGGASIFEPTTVKWARSERGHLQRMLDVENLVVI